MLSSLSELLIKKFVHSLFVYTRHTNKTRVSTETVIEYLASDGRNPMFRQFILSFYREWRETYQAQLESNDDARIVDAKTGKVAKTVQPAPVHPMKLEIPRLAPEVPSSELVNIVQVVPKDSPQKPVGGRKEAVPATEKKSVRSSAESFINQSLKQTVACKKLIKDLKLQFAEKKSTITIANEIYSFLSDLYNKLVMHILRNIMYIFTVTEKRTVVPEHVKAAYNALFESMRSQNQTASSDFALFREVSREATERTESFDKSANKNNIEHINRRIASNEAKLADLTFPLEKAGAVQKALAKDKQALARLSADVEVKEKKQPRKPAGEEEAEVKEADGDEEETETKEDGDEPEGDENTDNADEIDD
jgi:hypothetical protein